MKFSKIKDNDIANGIGITMSLWTQGCPHHCKGCFNGETWDFNSGKEFKKENLDYILENINKNSVQRDLSILGGEPLCPENVDGVIEVCKRFKEEFPNKKIYMWTGYTVDDFTERQKEVLKYLDVLVDGPFHLSLPVYMLLLRHLSCRFAHRLPADRNGRRIREAFRYEVPNIPVLNTFRVPDRKSTRLNSSHKVQSRMPSSA